MDTQTTKQGIVRTGITFLAIALIVTLLLLQANNTASAAQGGLSIGDEAPDFTLNTHDGKRLTLSKLEGKRGALLVFFATWCPACMAEVPEVKAFVEASKDKDILVYGINYKQSKDVIAKFVKDKGVNYRILMGLDDKVFQDYRVSGIPLLVGIDANGKVRYTGHSLPKDTSKLITELRTGIVKASETKKAEAPAKAVKVAPKESAPKASAALKKAGNDKDYMKDGISFISKETLQTWMKDDSTVVIDVLSPESYAKAHVKGAVNIPYADLKKKAEKLSKDARLVVYCANYQCHASTKAAALLTRLGFKNVHDYKGGIAEWKDAGLPIGNVKQTAK